MVNIRGAKKRILIIFSFLLAILLSPKLLIAKTDKEQQVRREVAKLAEQFVKGRLLNAKTGNNEIFSDSLLASFQDLIKDRFKNAVDSSVEVENERSYSAEVLGVTFIGKDIIRVFFEEHRPDWSNEIASIDFSYNIRKSPLDMERQNIEKIASQLINNFESKTDFQKNYDLLNDTVITWYKSIGIHDAKSYADSLGDVELDKTSKILGVAFVNEDSVRVFVKEFKSDKSTNVTFINFIKQQNGWKFRGYDARYICPD